MLQDFVLFFHETCLKDKKSNLYAKKIFTGRNLIGRELAVLYSNKDPWSFHKNSRQLSGNFTGNTLLPVKTLAESNKLAATGLVETENQISALKKLLVGRKIIGQKLARFKSNKDPIRIQ